MKFAIGSDHAALEEKAKLTAFLKEGGHEVTDHGTFTAESCDYPDYAALVGRAVAGGDAELGVLICGTGIGVSIAANKIKGVRAALIHEPFSASMAKEHNQANVLCFGARVTGETLMEACITAFLSASFGEGNHARRVGKINALDDAR